MDKVGAASYSVQGVASKREDGCAFSAPQVPSSDNRDDSGQEGDWLAEFFDYVDVLPPIDLEGCGLNGSGEHGEGVGASQKRERPRTAEDADDSVAKNKKSRREKLRREALNDRFLELSALLEPGKPPKTDKSTVVTMAAEVIQRQRKELSQLSSSLKHVQKLNERLEEEKAGLFADKAALQQDKAALHQDKLRLEHQLQCYLNHLPFASPAPFPVPFVGRAPPTLMHPPTQKVPLNPSSGNPSCPSIMWGFPPLVVHSTTPEEDAKLRAPVA